MRPEETALKSLRLFRQALGTVRTRKDNLIKALEINKSDQWFSLAGIRAALNGEIDGLVRIDGMLESVKGILESRLERWKTGEDD